MKKKINKKTSKNFILLIKNGLLRFLPRFYEIGGNLSINKNKNILYINYKNYYNSSWKYSLESFSKPIKLTKSSCDLLMDLIKIINILIIIEKILILPSYEA